MSIVNCDILGKQIVEIVDSSCVVFDCSAVFGHLTIFAECEEGEEEHEAHEDVCGHRDEGLG